MIKDRWYQNDRVIAIALATLVVIVLIASAPSIGVTWDEGGYIEAGQSYAAWFQQLVKNPVQAFQPDVIDEYWRVNHQHPPLEKTWSGLVWLAARGIFDELTANRLGDMLLMGLLVGLIFLLVSGEQGKAAGFFAAGAMLTMPRFFFHAHLAALDVPVAVATFVVALVFWKTLHRDGWAWGVLWGVAWGLAEAVKLNGDFIAIALVLWILIFNRSWKMVLRLGLMGAAGMVTFYAVWPWLYFHPIPRFVEYVNFHLQHFQVGQWYLGQFFMPPPWHFVFVMLWAVLPLTVVLTTGLGTVTGFLGRSSRKFASLLLLSVLVSLSPFFFGQSLIYDNERLFMPVFPFLAALAGIGFGWLEKWLRRWLSLGRRAAYATPLVAALAVVLLLPQALSIASLYPNLLSYYSEDVGGLPGASRLGLETTYWCESYSAALPYINKHAKAGDTIWVEPWSFVVLKYYQKIGELRPDLEVLRTGTGQFNHDADWFIFQYRQTQYGPGGENNYLPLRVLKAQKPVFRLSYQDVPIMELYGAVK